MNKSCESGFLIARIHLMSDRICSKILKRYSLDNINPAQGRILFSLWQGDGISIQELARKTALGKSTLTSMLDRLEQNGFVKRVPSLEDRRTILIKLTEKDRKLQNVYKKIIKEKIGLLLRGFTARESGELERYLMRIMNNLASYE